MPPWNRFSEHVLSIAPASIGLRLTRYACWKYAASILPERQASIMDESIQSKGGRARADALTASERSVIAKKAADARWSPDILNATHPGTLQIGGAEISCAVLEDGETHVLTRATFVRAIGRKGKVKG